MTIREFKKRCPDVEITDEQIAAADYLESRGKKFMIDFGYNSCGELAKRQFEKDEPCSTLQ